MNAQTQATPRPWSIGLIGNRVHVISTFSSVAEIAGTNADSHANARLIAAAPDLLAALQRIVQSTSGEVGNPTLLLRVIGDEARVALAKVGAP